MKFECLVAVAFCALSAGAQEGENPLRGPVQWAGTWTDSRVRLVLKRDGEGFSGELAVAGASHSLKAGPQVETSPKRLKGTFGPGAKEFPFTLEHEGDSLLLKSGGNHFRLSREGKLLLEDPTPRGKSSQVKVGQRYVFALQQNMELAFEVKEVGEGRVVYDMLTFMDMGKGFQPVGEPTEQTWEDRPVLEQAENSPEVERRVTTFKVGEHEFHALVVTMEVNDMAVESWVPISAAKKDAAPVFPGILKSISDGNVAMELIRIE